jgi:hypothetical protein
MAAFFLEPNRRNMAWWTNSEISKMRWNWRKMTGVEGEVTLVYPKRRVKTVGLRARDASEALYSF